MTNKNKALKQFSSDNKCVNAPLLMSFPRQFFTIDEMVNRWFYSSYVLDFCDETRQKAYYSKCISYRDKLANWLQLNLYLLFKGHKYFITTIK